MDIIDHRDISKLNEKLLQDKAYQIPSMWFFKQFDQETISTFCVKNAFYALPTLELINWLKKTIGERSAIEVGAGNGSLGEALSIPMTDSFLQEMPLIKARYEMLSQPTIDYGKSVERLNYKEAIKKYKPKVVIGSWLTQLWRDHNDDGNGNMYGIDEEWIIDNVESYIHIGNEKVHGRKRILERPHNKFKLNSLFSRSMSADQCMIWVWD